MQSMTIERRDVATPPPTAVGLRLLHVGPVPPPWSGMGTSFQNLLASAPLSVQTNWIIDTSPGKLPGDPNRPKRPTPGRITRHLSLAWRIIKQVRQHRVQVVHLHGSSHDLSFFANWLSVVGARLAGAKVVWHLHEDLSVVQFPGRRTTTRAPFAAAMRGTNLLAVMTEKDRQVATALLPARKVVVIPPACAPDMLALPLERPYGTRHILFVGWLTEAKGIFDLLRTASAVRERGVELVFDVLGSGMTDEENAAVRACIAAHGLHEQVILHGVVTGAAKAERFAAAHALCHPTHWDAFPVSVLEAMAAGLPVVGTRVGGLPIMLGEVGGHDLVEVGDTARMADQLIALAQDEEGRLRIGQANRERFQARYHPDMVGQRALDAYQCLLGDKR